MRLTLAALIALATVHTTTLAVQDFTVTREDLALMPPYCTAIYGHHVGLPRFNESPLRNTHPPGCNETHHYCDALKGMVRADRYAGRDRNESSFWLTSALASFQDIVSVWEKNAPNCSLRAEAHTNLGKVLLRKETAGAAVINFNKALELQPTYLPAYYALSDYYLNIGKKREALTIVEQGLKYRPDAKGLHKRFKELGGTTLPEPIAITAPQASTPSDTMAEQKQPVAEAVPDEKQAPATSPAPPEQTAVEPAKPRSTKNPYCRFCAE